MRNIIGNIIQANKMFGLIKNKDRIAIGVSGGKDSLLMWYALDIYCKKLKDELNWDVEIKAFHVNINYVKNTDYSKINEFAKKHNLLIEYIDSDIGEILKRTTNKGKVQCSLCSKMKKAVLIEKAKQQNYRKLAMAHHADDAIETLWLNLLNEGRISTFKPITFLDRSDVYLIRPLILAREKEIIKESKKLKLPIIQNACPNEHSTQRAEIKEFIEKNFYKSSKWKNSYINMLSALYNGENSYLWFYNEEDKFENLMNKVNENKEIV